MPGAGDRRGPDRMIVAFARALRGVGLAVPVASVLVFAEALGEVGLDHHERVYWAGRATLVRRPEDVAAYDRVFASFWTDRPLLPSEDETRRPEPVVTDDPDGAGADERDAAPARTVRWSAAEVLRQRDFSSLTEDEWAELQVLLARLRNAPETRPSRRRRPDHRHRGHPDLRRTLRRALRTGGEPLDRAWRAPGRRPRRVVLLVDVSGSMEPYARALMCFAHAAVGARGASGVEVFTLGTRLTRVSRELADRDPDAAVRAAADVVADWSGGTRLGVSLEEFNDRWGTRGMARGAIVVVLSDGWDRGEPEQVAEQMQRLSRVAHRIVWSNPLKATPGYAPLARGMAAALPYVDDFVEGHSFGALEQLAAVIGGVGRGSAGHVVRSRVGSAVVSGERGALS